MEFSDWPSDWSCIPGFVEAGLAIAIAYYRPPFAQCHCQTAHDWPAAPLQIATMQSAARPISLPYKLIARTDTMTPPLTSPTAPARPASWVTALLAGIVILIFFTCC